GGGAFGSNADTAAALIALSGSRQNRATAVNAARAALVASQAANGSWDSSARATALAVRALAASGPDWRVKPDEFGVAVLYFRDPEPLQAQPVAARLDVENRSPFPAPATTIRFLGGGRT